MDDQLDDQRFEAYLRSFRPLPPAPLPRRQRPWRFVALSAAAAAGIAGLLLDAPFRRVPPVPAEPQSITIGSANQRLANSPSWKSMIDDASFAFHSQADVAPRRSSALEFLGQEDLSQ